MRIFGDLTLGVPTFMARHSNPRVENRVLGTKNFGIDFWKVRNLDIDFWYPTFAIVFWKSEICGLTFGNF